MRCLPGWDSINNNEETAEQLLCPTGHGPRSTSAEGSEDETSNAWKYGEAQLLEAVYDISGNGSGHLRGSVQHAALLRQGAGGGCGDGHLRSGGSRFARRRS